MSSSQILLRAPKNLKAMIAAESEQTEESLQAIIIRRLAASYGIVAPPPRACRPSKAKPANS